MPPLVPRLAGAVAAGLAAVLLAGCATTAGPGAPEPADGPPTLTIATGFAIEDLDPLLSGYWGPEFGYVELLMRPERSGEPTPWVLSALTATDPSTWVLDLREGVTFQNGTALDAQALADLIAFQIVENADAGAALSGAVPRVTGPLQVTLTTSRPIPNLPTLLADESIVPVFDVAAYRAHRDSGAPASELIAAGIYTGPFTVDGLDGATMELSPRTDHHDGAPALEDLTIRFVPEASARIQAV